LRVISTSYRTQKTVNAKLHRNSLPPHRIAPFISTILRDFARRRARGRLILRATIRGLGWLHLDTILLSAVVVTLIRASGIVSRVAICLARAIRGRGLLAVVLVVVVVVVGRCGVGVVAGHGARGPAGAVEGLATGLAAAAGCEATRK
jgi:hypothetical protein